MVGTMKYDYKKGKTRIDKILQEHVESNIVKVIPENEKMMDSVYYYGKVTAIFVDIRKSTKLFSDSEKTSTARIIKCFTSEIIEMLHNGDNLREIGVRGDCVYAIYSTPEKKLDFDIFNATLLINNYLKMLNKTLSHKKMRNIKAGIGIATSKDLVIQAGNENKQVYSKVWIGKGVTSASKLSNCANSKNRKPILVNREFYNNINEYLPSEYKKKTNCGFDRCNLKHIGEFYGVDFDDEEFKNWIDRGME